MLKYQQKSQKYVAVSRLYMYNRAQKQINTNKHKQAKQPQTIDVWTKSVTKAYACRNIQSKRHGIEGFYSHFYYFMVLFWIMGRRPSPSPKFKIFALSRVIFRPAFSTISAYWTWRWWIKKRFSGMFKKDVLYLVAVKPL